MICTTNAIDSLKARYRWAAHACGQFPHDAAALNSLYLTARSLAPAWTTSGATRRRLEGSNERVRDHLQGRSSPLDNLDAGHQHSEDSRHSLPRKEIRRWTFQ